MQRMDSSDRGDPSCNCSSGILVSMDRGAISFLWPTTSIEEVSASSSVTHDMIRMTSSS